MAITKVPNNLIDLSGDSGAVPWAAGTTAQRPGSPNAGDLGIGFGAVPNLQGHVQLLATMSQRAARRSPISDQKLVEICLTNASYRGSKEQARLLIENNLKLREREMGRLAAMVFDFSYHRSGE